MMTILTILAYIVGFYLTAGLALTITLWDALPALTWMAKDPRLLFIQMILVTPYLGIIAIIEDIKNG